MKQRRLHHGPPHLHARTLVQGSFALVAPRAAATLGTPIYILKTSACFAKISSPSLSCSAPPATTDLTNVLVNNATLILQRRHLHGAQLGFDGVERDV